MLLYDNNGLVVRIPVIFLVFRLSGLFQRISAIRQKLAITSLSL